MSIGIMAVLLLGALLHAIWNALVRAGADKTLTTILIVSGAGVVTACWLPFVPAPAVASWPYLAASVLIHVVYFTFVALSYRSADLSFAYPIMRGTAPAISAVAVAFLLGESPSALGWLGVLVVSSSIVLLAGESWRSGALRLAPTALALANAGVIVIYTVVDGVGARASGNPFSYTGWLILLTAAPMTIACFVIRPRYGRVYTCELCPCPGWWRLHLWIVWTGALGHDPCADCARRRPSRNICRIRNHNCGYFPS